jgi:PAS domain S-box-containing protein
MYFWVALSLGLVVAGLLVLTHRRAAAWHRTMAARAEEQVRLLALFEGSPLPTWVIDRATLRFLETNDAALRQYGYTREAFGDLTLKDIRIPEEWPDLDRVLADVRAQRGVQRATHRRKDGTQLKVEIHAQDVTYGGRPAVLAITEDITGRLGAEQALRESEAQFRAMADASPAGVVMMTPLGDFRYVNHTALRMLGMPLERALGAGWMAGLHPDDRDRLGSEWRAASAARQPYIGAGRFLHADGRVFWWRMRTSPVWADDTCLGHVAVIVDETEQRSAEEALRESEERFRQLAEHIPAVVYLVEPETGSMLFISPAYERIWGRTRSSLYTSPWSFLDAVHPDDQERVRHTYQKRLARLTVEYRITRPDGEVLWIEDLQFPIRRADGSIYLVAGLAFDITRRARLETQLIESQKMESLGRLAGGVAHDFNNLLTVILSYADLLKEAPNADQELISGLEEIESAGQRAASLTRQLLTFARRQVVDPRVLNLNETLMTLEPLIHHLVGDRIAVDLRPVAERPTCRLDANQIDQVVMNLVSNARDAMPEGGTLRVDTASVLGPIPGTEVPAGDWVALTIADTGVGIPADVRAQVFDPFFTTKPKGQGTGLGLSTSYGIVTQFGGLMELTSQVGRGTVVTCYFPSVAAATATLREQVLVPTVSAGTETVLVVEDEPMVRDVARATLERQGYHVVTASNGMEGLKVVGDLGDTIDLVVTDVVMPQMGGWEMAERLRIDRPEMKILFTSGYNEEIANAGGRVGDDVAFLPKPYLPAALTQRVRQVLDAV